MQDNNLDTMELNQIIKKIIDEIASSREQILQIVDSIRNEQERLLSELAQITKEIHKVIDEVDTLEKQDKVMRMRLAEVSANFKRFIESDIKAAYEKASDSRVKLITKRSEETNLKERRYSLELALKRLLENIVAGEKIISQISIALGYLEGGILNVLEDADRNSEILTGIKVLEAQENERKRIARDIHDGPAQHMASVIMRVDICKKVLVRNLQDGLMELDDLKNSVKTALKEVRSIIFNLRPASLEDMGLNEVIEETVKGIIQESGIDTHFKLKSNPTNLNTIIQVAVYRVVQEIFNNIRKHARAKHAEVKLDFGTDSLALVISDDGVGFNVEEALNKAKTTGTSYGLLSMLDRVKQLQGDIEIKSSERTGTIYYVKLPISLEVVRNEKESS